MYEYNSVYLRLRYANSEVAVYTGNGGSYEVTVYKYKNGTSRIQVRNNSMLVLEFNS